MSYLRFLLVYVVPPLLVLSALAALRLRRGLPALGCYLVLALGFTAPWDSYLIRHEVWRHGQVIGRLLLVPLEEYGFIIGQTLITGLFTLLLAQSWSAAVLVPRRFSTAGWFGVALVSWLFHPLWTPFAVSDHWFYLTAILGWFGPLIALQVAVGGDRLAAARRVRWWAIGLPTGYLWVADRVAIGAGTWWINPDRTLGLRPFGLPVEEALFFLVTNVVLVNGLLLALDNEMWARTARLWRRTAEVVHA